MRHATALARVCGVEQQPESGGEQDANDLLESPAIRLILAGECLGVAEGAAPASRVGRRTGVDECETPNPTAPFRARPDIGGAGGAMRDRAVRRQ
jgi:hypothetical protein